MTLALGFYSLRNGEFAHITQYCEDSLYGYILEKNDRMRFWKLNGDYPIDNEYDLVEYLKVKENGSHEGVSIKELIKKKEKERK